MPLSLPTIDDVHRAATVIREHISPAPLIRSHPLEQSLGLPADRRVWLKDYGWTPVGSFKLLGALNWMHHHQDDIGIRPVAAHSSGNFASGIAFAGQRYGKRVMVVMPESAPQIKFDRTRSFGAEIRTYDAASDHITGDRQRMTCELAEQEGAVQASPYDDPHVIAGNGVGGLEIVKALQRNGRELSHFVCAVSGGGLMAGHALPIVDGYRDANIVAVEPALADDFRQSLEAGERVRIEHPQSICDGLLSYDVGAHNWPILQQHITTAVAVADASTMNAMRWLYDHHGLRTEPSGAIGVAAVLEGLVSLDGQGDVVIVLSGRNIDDQQFRTWISPISPADQATGRQPG